MTPKFIAGQSLLEVVIALAIFSLIAAAFVSLTLGSISSVGYGTDFLTAGTLADEGVGIKRATRDNAWNTLIDGVESTTVDGRFNRTITISPVALETKFLKSEVSWPSPFGVMQKVTRQTKLTNWDSRDWIQTDWSGGQYTSVDPTLDVGTVGQISLKAKPVVWSLFVDTGTQTWNDIFMISATDGFIVGNGGLIRRWNGSNWNTAPSSGTTRNLNSVACSSATNCFAVGASGTILRWTGGPNWSFFTSTGGQTWNDIFMISATDGFIVGNGGLIRRWNGSNWNTAPSSGTTRNLNSVACSSATNCFAVGASGTILRWTGGPNWSFSPSSPTAQNLNAVFLMLPNDGWSVGASGVILRLSGGGYETSGSLVSSAFNMSDLSPVQIIGWDEIIPACVPVSACAIKLNIKVAARANGLAAALWSPDFTVAAGNLIDSSYNGRLFVQYQATLIGDGISTPVLQEVRLNYK